MSEKITYLYQNKQIQSILAQGFAKICQQKPKFPIYYLARFLKNHLTKTTQKQSLLLKLQHNQQTITQMHNMQQQSLQLLQKTRQQQQVKLSQEQQFLNRISLAQRHEQVLDYFCEWVNSRLDNVAVYVGELESQARMVDTRQQDAEEAHLQLDKEKIIKFRYASEGQQRVVTGKVLGLDSLLGRLVAEAQVESTTIDQQGGQNQEDNRMPMIKGEIYIPSVVGNQELKYFTFPKLGAYFASVMTVKCYLKEKLFDQNTVKVQSYRKIMHDFQKQSQEKQAKFQQILTQRTNSGVDQSQLQTLQRQFQRQKSQTSPPVLQQLNSQQRKFAICVDTLGLDRQITASQKQTIRVYITHLRHCWQDKQQQLLLKDITHQLSLVKPQNQEGQDGEIPNYTEQYAALLEEEEKEVNSNEEVQRVKDTQKLWELQGNTLRFQKTKEYLADEKYMHFWEHLLHFSVIKYGQVIKQLFILLGFRKDQCCLKGTNLFDWEKTKLLISNNRERIFEQLASTSVRGSKPDLIQPYAKCYRIEKNLEGLDPLIIANYNIYLAFILRFLQLYTKTRIQDRQVRLTKTQVERQNREQKIKEASQKVTQKKQKLESIKAELQQKGQLQAFDQQAWMAQYDEENPPIQIPEQAINDVDRDIQDPQVQKSVQLDEPKQEQ